MNKKTLFIILLLFLLQHCGYSPIYTNVNSLDYKLNVINISGDNDINNLITTYIKRYSNLSENKSLDLNIKTDYIKNVLSKSEISAYRHEIKKVAEERNKDKDKEFGGAFYQALNIRYDSKGVEKFCLSKRLGKIAADLMKVNAVRIFHEQAIFKHPGDTKSYWHQDQFFL